MRNRRAIAARRDAREMRRAFDARLDEKRQATEAQLDREATECVFRFFLEADMEAGRWPS